MDAIEFALATLEKSRYQVEKVFEGLPEPLREVRLTEKAMTPSETVFHLCEVAHAFPIMARGEKYEWGSFRPSVEGFEAGLGLMRELRDRAVEGVRASGDPAQALLAMEFFALHEAYHVGQLVQLRATHQPDWDPYCIYSDH